MLFDIATAAAAADDQGRRGEKKSAPVVKKVKRDQRAAAAACVYDDATAPHTMELLNNTHTAREREPKIPKSRKSEPLIVLYRIQCVLISFALAFFSAVIRWSIWIEVNLFSLLAARYGFC